MNTPFADDSWDTFGLLKETFIALDERFAEAVAGVTDLDRAVVDLLIRVARSPDERARPTDLARDLSMVPSRITRCIDDATSRGLLNRVPHPTDGRSTLVELADEGRRVLECIEPPMREVGDRYLHDFLGERDIRTLERILRRTRDHARR